MHDQGKKQVPPSGYAGPGVESVPSDVEESPAFRHRSGSHLVSRLSPLPTQPHLQQILADEPRPNRKSRAHIPGFRNGRSGCDADWQWSQCKRYTQSRRTRLGITVTPDPDEPANVRRKAQPGLSDRGARHLHSVLPKAKIYMRLAAPIHQSPTSQTCILPSYSTPQTPFEVVSLRVASLLSVHAPAFECHRRQVPLQ